MQAVLIEIAEISHGYSFRGRIEADPNGDVLVIQAKDMGGDGVVDFSQAIRKSDVPIRSSLLLRAGDVLLQPRGVTYRAGKRRAPRGVSSIAERSIRSVSMGHIRLHVSSLPCARSGGCLERFCADQPE